MLHASSFGKVFLSLLLSFVVSAMAWEVIAEQVVSKSPSVTPGPEGGVIHPSGRYVYSAEGFSRTFYRHVTVRGDFPAPGPYLRVLAVGDSFTEAFQVSDDETYCSVAERLLNSAGLAVKFYNVGISGGDPAQYVGMAHYYDHLVDPSRVVIELNQGDIESDLDRRDGPFYIKPQAGTFQLASNPSRTGSGFHLANFSLVRLALQKLSTSGSSPSDEGAQSGKKPITAALVEKWRSYVQWSVQNLKERYPGPVVVYMPTIDYFHLESAPHPIEALLDEECRKDAVPFLDMRQAFVQEFLRSHRMSNGFPNTSPGVGHINALGHQLVGRGIAKLLQEGFKN